MYKYITTERADLFDPNITIAMSFDIAGDPAVTDLREAINLAIEANEVLKSKIVIGTNGQAWYEPCEHTYNSIAISDKHWLTILQEQEGKRFHYEDGELMRVFILHNQEQTRLLILAHHLAGDGKSLVYFVQDVMEALSGKELKYKGIGLLTPEALPKKSKLPFYIKMYAEKYNKAWEKKKCVFDVADYARIHKAYWESRKTTVITEWFSKQELDNLKEKARAAQVSVNSYVLAAFFKEYGSRAVAGMAVDGRIDGNKNMGNQATGISVNYCYNDVVTMNENAQNIHREIYKKLNKLSKKYLVLHFMGALNCNLVDSICMYLYGDYENKVTEKLARVMGYSRNLKDISITNLTKLDIPQSYGKYRISDFVFVPPIVSYGKRITGIATLGDEMIITYHVFQDEHYEEESCYFKNVMKILKK